MDSQQSQDPQAPTMCAAGCGFFGTPAGQGLDHFVFVLFCVCVCLEGAPSSRSFLHLIAPPQATPPTKTSAASASVTITPRPSLPPRPSWPRPRQPLPSSQRQLSLQLHLLPLLPPPSSPLPLLRPLPLPRARIAVFRVTRASACLVSLSISRTFWFSVVGAASALHLYPV
jgi:hypothetical protein